MFSKRLPMAPPTGKKVPGTKKDGHEEMEITQHEISIVNIYVYGFPKPYFST
jgi:hypothetical protein